MRYLTVGTDEIRRDLFSPVVDSSLDNDIKPSGGLWFTEFDENDLKHNFWVDYMLDNLYVFYYKNKSSDPYRVPCCVASLREDAKIFFLDSMEKYEMLVSEFSFGNGSFSFELVSDKYDGIYIDLSKLVGDVRKLFDRFDVNSLILFNVDCISCYCNGVVDIVPFDFEEARYEYLFDYNIRISDDVKYVVDDVDRVRR